LACFHRQILKRGISWPVLNNMPWKWLLHLNPLVGGLRWHWKGRKQGRLVLFLVNAYFKVFKFGVSVSKAKCTVPSQNQPWISISLLLLSIISVYT
jgi:hypothetical protein